MQSGECVVSGNTVTQFGLYKRTYQPGIHWAGVDNNYTHNTVTNGPHACIAGGGNDAPTNVGGVGNLFEYVERRKAPRATEWAVTLTQLASPRTTHHAPRTVSLGGCPWPTTTPLASPQRARTLLPLASHTARTMRVHSGPQWCGEQQNSTCPPPTPS